MPPEIRVSAPIGNLGVAMRSVRPCLVVAAEPAVVQAVAKTMDLFGMGSQDASSFCPAEHVGTPVGLAVRTASDPECADHDWMKLILQLDAAGVWSIVAVGAHFDKLLEGLGGQQAAEIDDRIRSGPVPDLAKLVTEAAPGSHRACPQRHGNVSATAVSGLFRAKLLWDVVRRFSHGQKLDLANACLAPARIRLAVGDPKFDWDSRLVQSLLEEFPTDPILLGGTGNRLRELLRQCNGDDGKPDLAIVTEVMELLTVIRVEAGQRHVPRFQPVPLSVPPNQGNCESRYKILVVDDFWAAWKPVFVLVQAMLAEKGWKVEVEYSEDAQRTNLQRPISTAAADVDFVLLDIFFGEKPEGLGVLESIRKQTRWLPVVLWTSSRDELLPATANLANGFLFKKSTNVEEIAATIGLWLEEGRARQVGTLVNRWFDQQIRSSTLRKFAYDLQLWCLTEMAAFHLLDLDHLRYFNDHGGRHLVAILNRVEALFKPLFDEPRVLSSNSEEREQELLALFVAALIHEIGMFPLPGESDYDSKSARTWHGPRGLLRVWASHGCALDEVLKPVRNNMAFLARVAVLVGYHTRKLDFNSFLDAPKTLSGFDRESEFSNALTAISAALESGSVERTRLKAQAAMFRFADGIDVDASRNPGETIRTDQGVRADNLREYLKRTVLREIAVRASGPRIQIDVEVSCPAPGWLRPSRRACLTGTAQVRRGQFPRRPCPAGREWLDRFVTRQLERRQRSPALCVRQAAAVAAILEIVEEFQGITQVGMVDRIALGRVRWRRPVRGRFS